MVDQLKKMRKLTEEIVESYEIHGGINRIDQENLPSRENVFGILNDLFILLFPGYFGNQQLSQDNIYFFVNGLVDSLYVRMKDEIERALVYDSRRQGNDCIDCDVKARTITENILETIPDIRKRLKMDVKAAYEGDPAAKNYDEIISCYPGVEAITVYRIAHELFKHSVPLIPRMMTENAHERTGIDIHPGANIGDYFFIDHGTGVVVGETTRIGKSVKIYQGVTLGALSFRKDKEGNIVKSGKRHPTIADNVVIYSGATILGGDTVIGDGAVVGANTWIVNSVPPGTVVTITVNQEAKEKLSQTNAYSYDI